MTVFEKIESLQKGLEETDAYMVGQQLKENLKPCPWCGSESFFVDRDENGWYVECNGCLSQGPRAETQEKAEKAWNRRANHE